MNGRRKLGWILGAAGAAMISGAVLVGPGTASATVNPATYGGNVDFCSQVGYPSSIQYNGSTTSGVYDAGGMFTATVANPYVTIRTASRRVVGFQA